VKHKTLDLSTELVKLATVTKFKTDVSSVSFISFIRPFVRTNKGNTICSFKLQLLCKCSGQRVRKSEDCPSSL